MVVPVLITSCQVSLKWKYEPVKPHVRTTTTASRNAAGRPVACAVHLVKRVNQLRWRVGLIGSFPAHPTVRRRVLAAARSHQRRRNETVQALVAFGPSTRRLASALRRHSLSSRTSSFRPALVIA